MFFVAGLLVILTGLFYSAGHHELGASGAQLCQYGDLFCDNPIWLLVGAGAAAVWGALVSVR